MRYHLDLPNFIKSFVVKDINYENILPKTNKHDWTVNRTDKLLSKEGLDYFRSNKIFIKETCRLYRIPKNFTGAIHIDGVDSIEVGNTGKNIYFNRYAINIILQGYGEMQWISGIKGKEIINETDLGTYQSFSDAEKYEIADVWKGEVGLVRIHTPHRVVCYEEDRICLSLIANFPKNFEEAYDTLSNSK